MEVGGLKLGLNVVVLMIAGAVWLGRRRRIFLASAKATLALLICLIASWLLALSGPCTDQFMKAAFTVPILVFLVLIGIEIGRAADDKEWINLEKTAVWLLLTAFAGFAVEMIVPQYFPSGQGYRAEGRYSGIFTEPSHAAFSLFPCIAVLLVAESKRSRRRGLAALLGLIVVSRSSTLIALTAAWILYRLVVRRKLRHAGLLLLGAASIIAVASAVNFDALVAPTIERVVGIGAADETTNISSLVYVQGWGDTWANLFRTHGRGLGVNMMGCSPLPDLPVRVVLDKFFPAGINAQDGSFLFAKVVSETGVVGIASFGAILWWWIRLEKRLVKEKDVAHHFASVTQAAMVFCFLASGFIRGVGYFSGGLLLLVAAMNGGYAKSARHILASNSSIGVDPD